MSPVRDRSKQWCEHGFFGRVNVFMRLDIVSM